MVKKKKNKYQDSNFISQIEQYIAYLRLKDIMHQIQYQHISGIYQIYLIFV
jgi:hypothetical protein